MSKFSIGDCVKFRGKELELPSLGVLSIKLDSDKFIGKVSGSIDCGPNGTEYFIDVNVHGMTWKIRVKEDQIISLKDYVIDMVDGFAKKVQLKMSEQTSRELNRICENLRKDCEVKPRILTTINPDYNSWIKDMCDKWEKTHPKFDPFILSDPKMVLGFGFDYAKMPESKPKPENEKKMTKQRCVKLLEAYRAEREKIAKGRRFERCLRDSVINEALERAIEILKGGAE